MFKEIIVLFLAIAIVSVIAFTYRLRLKNFGKILGDEKNREDNETLYDLLSELTLPQLEHKLQKLERRLITISSGYISMSDTQQKHVVEGVKEIKGKIRIVKEVIESRRLSR